MIVTIKSPTRKLMNRGMFEAMKMGVEFEDRADNTFDIIAFDQSKVDGIASAAGGQVIYTSNTKPM